MASVCRGQQPSGGVEQARVPLCAWVARRRELLKAREAYFGSKLLMEVVYTLVELAAAPGMEAEVRNAAREELYIGSPFLGRME